MLRKGSLKKLIDKSIAVFIFCVLRLAGFLAKEKLWVCSVLTLSIVLSFKENNIIKSHLADI